MKEFFKGQYVTYSPPNGKEEKGRVKSIPDNPSSVFVVFNCGGDWKHYEDYTAQLTPVEYLSVGWGPNSNYLLNKNEDTNTN